MKKMKTSIVLLTLLLAAMAMVPLVSAANDSGITGSLPQLTINESQQKTVISHELSTVAGKDVYHIPEGSIIHHTADGLTRVFDASGTQLFVADDAGAAQITTPNGLVPATHVHEIPSGALVTEKNKNTVVLYQGKLLMTIIDDGKQVFQKNGIATDSAKTSGIVPMTSPFSGWIEWAYDWTSSSNPLGEFDAYWTVPSQPTSRPGTGNNAHTIFLFNGIRDYPNYNTIIQPVLEWNNKDTGYYWDLASWSLSGSSSFHSSRISATVGDQIKGVMQWSSSSNSWYVTTYDITRGSSTSLTTTWSPNPASGTLEPDIALEGWQITGNTDAPGSTLFQNIVYKKTNGQMEPIVLKKYISGSTPLTQLNVEILTNPSKVKLDTANT